MINIYTDGGSRGNPGPSACAFLIMDSEIILAFDAIYTGINTNNFAEYSGLLLASKYIKKNIKHNSEIQIYMDSELVVNQMTGKFKINNDELNKLKKLIDQNLVGVKYKISHIERSKNSHADKLVNIVLDSIEN